MLCDVIQTNDRCRPHIFNTDIITYLYLQKIEENTCDVLIGARIYEGGGGGGGVRSIDNLYMQGTFYFTPPARILILLVSVFHINIFTCSKQKVWSIKMTVLNRGGRSVYSCCTKYFYVYHTLLFRTLDIVCSINSEKKKTKFYC